MDLRIYRLLVTLINSFSGLHWEQKLNVREWEENETASINTVRESCGKGEK